MKIELLGVISDFSRN